MYLAILVIVVTGAGCRGEPSERSRILSVFAASSLLEAFQELAADFESANPTVDVRVSFAGSQVLRLQLEQGATADVFASANEEHMTALTEAGIVSESRIFALNELVVIAPARGAERIQSFTDLPRAERLVIGTESVPVGIYTRMLFDRARSAMGEEFVTRLQERIVSEENNVRLVRAKIELGEVDAAIVYRTDAESSPRVRAIPIPDSLNVRAVYPIATVRGSASPDLADRFLEHVGSDEGRATLRDHGFLVPGD